MPPVQLRRFTYLDGALTAALLSEREPPERPVRAFERLAATLESRRAIGGVDAATRAVRRGAIVEVEGRVALPDVAPAKASPPAELIAMVPRLVPRLVAVATPRAAPDWTFLVPLDERWLRTDPAELGGPASVLGIVAGSLPRGETWSVLAAMGPEAVGWLVADPDVITPPAAFLTPLAVYH